MEKGKKRFISRIASSRGSAESVEREVRMAPDRLQTVLQGSINVLAFSFRALFLPTILPTAMQDWGVLQWIGAI
jgi:hypothetical protein